MVVLVFLANHCPVVTAYEDRIIDLANELKGKSVKFVGVSVNRMDSDRLPAIKERVKDKGYNYVYGFDESQKIGKAYGATVTPQFFVLDKDRVIRYTGALDDNQDESKVTKTYVKDAVNALLNGETIEVTETRAKGCGIRYEKRLSTQVISAVAPRGRTQTSPRRRPIPPAASPFRPSSEPTRFPRRRRGADPRFAVEVDGPASILPAPRSHPDPGRKITVSSHRARFCPLVLALASSAVSAGHSRGR